MGGRACCGHDPGYLADYCHYDFSLIADVGRGRHREEEEEEEEKSHVSGSLMGRGGGCSFVCAIQMWVVHH